MTRSAAVFLDRDGTVIVDKGYLGDVAGVELLPGAGEALARLAAAGFLLILITNQSGIGRGFFPHEVVDRQHARLRQLLEPYGVEFAAIAVCPHAPEQNCDCRKPSPKLLQNKARELRLDMAASFMVGDKDSDMAAGRAAGCAAVIAVGHKLATADYQAASITEAAAWIISQQQV